MALLIYNISLSSQSTQGILWNDFVSEVPASAAFNRFKRSKGFVNPGYAAWLPAYHRSKNLTWSSLHLPHSLSCRRRKYG